MDPVSLSVSILLPAVGWLVEATISKNIEEAWQNYVKSVDLHKDNENLKAELNKIKLLVEAADSATLQGQKVKLMNDYLKEVKKLVYEARDLIDEFDYFRLQEEVKKVNKPKHGKALTIFKSLGPSDVPSSSKARTCNELKLHKRDMSSRFNDLTQKLKLAYESLNPVLTNQLLSSIANGMQTVTNQIAPSKRPQTTALRSNEKVYGRDGDKEIILKLIKSAKHNSQQPPVITIVGNGGVGKTTLAQLIYDDSTTSFSKKIWICVSTDFNDVGITRKILESLNNDGRRCDGENLSTLKEIIRDKLKKERVLLVLDDIWKINSEDEWVSLLVPFNPNSSTILVTTRDLSIVNMVKTIDPVIQLDGLEENSFWSLFKKCALGDDQCMVPHELEDIGKAIVKRLKGYPLAAKTVGALLKGKMDIWYWDKVLKSEKWKFQVGNNDIMPALRLSYEYLPVHLQQCFSYCSLFPKDYEFEAKKLVHMWMAQDYICTEEDVGFGYLETLVNRAFFQMVINQEDEAVYVIHDLMHDLAQAVSSEEILVINHPEHTPDLPNLRHLSFFLNTKYTIENCVQFQNLSSLVINKNTEAPKGTLNWHQPNRFRLLILPFTSSISYNFTHLRYLKLYCNLYHEEMAAFPVQICRLYHLQVLELENWHYLSDLPKEFNNLVNLQHFIASDHLHSMIIGVGRLKHLQELKKFVVREEKGFELCQLSELEKLRGSLTICSLQNVKRREEVERVKLSKKNIDKLKLFWYDETDDETKETEDYSQKNGAVRGKWRGWVKRKGRECGTSHTSSEEILEAMQPNNELRHLRIENYGGCKSPSWLTNTSIKCLESIRLSHCEAWEELPNFGQLVYLKKLYLSHLPKVKALGPQFHGCGPMEGFLSLKVMRVCYMAELKTWVWSQGFKAYPSLEELEVICCPNLVDFTFLNLVSIHGESIELFPKLEYLKIEDCDRLQQSPKISSYLSPDRICVGDIHSDFGTMQYQEYQNHLKIENVKDREVLAFIFSNLSFKNIRWMEIVDCPNITSLSWKYICMINSLKRLKIKMCYDLCFLPVEKEKDDGSIFYSHESLQELEIRECGVIGDELSYLLAHLPAICKLSIVCCFGIGNVSLPTIVEVDNAEHRISNSLACLDLLYIENCHDMVFVNGERLSGLTALEELQIYSSDNLLYSIMQKEGSNYVQDLTISYSNATSLKLNSFVALRQLCLVGCNNLAAVEGPNLPACPVVEINNCPRLAKTEGEIEQKFLMHVGELYIDNIEFISIHTNISTSLRSLTIKGIYPRDWNEWTEEQEKALIEHLTALEELNLQDCSGLCSLPSMLYRHPCLRELTICSCPKIKSLPQRGFPKTLQKLLLKDCSEELKSQCSQLEDFERSEETDECRYKYDAFSKRDPSAN